MKTISNAKHFECETLDNNSRSFFPLLIIMIFSWGEKFFTPDTQSTIIVHLCFYQNDELKDQKDFSAQIIQEILSYHKTHMMRSCHRAKRGKLQNSWELKSFLFAKSFARFPLWCCERTNKLSFSIKAHFALSSHIPFDNSFMAMEGIKGSRLQVRNPTWACEKITFVVCLIC